MKNSSFLVSFEGIECSGKSTHIQSFISLIKDQSLSAQLFREPGATTIGEKIRTILLDPTLEPSETSALFLFLASRAQLITEKVFPALENKGQVVILDRYLDSSIAYQGAGEGLGEQWVEKLHDHFPLDLRPHITFYLDISVQCSFDRMKKRGDATDRIEKKDKDYFEAVRNSYLNLSTKFPERIKLIDAEQPIDKVFNDIKEQWEAFLKDGHA
ncbi:MAG: dTMP kinase [Halobacteriovoraceae bacterium]|nr:dTMP kinase [Halobacteriovoraceae bacterium]MCB9095738.1 dTMP kinase [Halobacteriovoraceae bacterium]